MAISKPKIASIVASQVPEFVREDYATFMAFLEAYYNYLEDYNVDLKTIRDIDTTLEDFIKYFKAEVAHNIPYSVVNERFLLTHIKDQYLAKGSEASFKLLFRLLFNKEVTVEYPSTQILKPSDGKWQQEVSLFAYVNLGTPDMIVGKLVDVVTPNKIIRVMIDRRQDVEVEVNRVVQIAENVYEFYIDRRFFGDINIGDRIRLGTIFDATILPTTSKITIQQGGRNFKVGQLYQIRNGNGAGTVVKVTKTDSDGSIISAECIRFGINYDTDFTATFIASSTSVITSAGAAFSIIGNQISFNDYVNGFIEQGIINKTDYVELGVWDGTYSGEILREFFQDSAQQVIDPLDPAIIKVELGALTKYPGYFKNNDGFLDDAIYIQDSKYYQAFSYVIKIDERLDDYRSAVKTLIHPAGMAIFGEYDVRNEFDISAEIEFILKVLAVTIQDLAYASDAISTIRLNKAVTDSITVPDEIGTGATRTFPYYTFSKSITATTLNYDAAVDNETVIMSDEVGSNGTRTVPFFGISKTIDVSTVGYDDTTTPSDAISTIGVNKALDDTQVMDDLISSVDFGKLLEDSQVVDEQLAVSVNKYINNALDDNITTTESGNISVNPYAISGWFAADYVGNFTYF